MKRIIFKENDLVSDKGIRYVRELPPKRQPCGNIRRVCEFRCECGKTFQSLLSDVRCGHRTSCGCKKGAKPKKYKKGEKINGIKFIKTLGTVFYAQRAIFECPVCGSEWESYVGNIQHGNTKSCCKIKRGWGKSEWTGLYKIAYLYKVRLYNENESFIKIGITGKKNIRSRLRFIPYNYEIIKTIEGEAGYIYDLENRLKRFLKACKYTPAVDFRGSTECYEEKVWT